MIPWPLLLLGCGAGDPAASALSDAPADPREALAACAVEPFEQLQVLCRIEAAAHAAHEGEEALAAEACALVPEGTWLQECHFRVGEELARAGQPAAGLPHCARAGRFDRFCVTHAAWVIPVELGRSTDADAPAQAAAIHAQLVPIVAAGAGLEADLRREAADSFRMSLWYMAYLGTGRADPAKAQAADPDEAPAARSAWALEAARLLAPGGGPLPQDAVARLQAAWREGTVTEGPPLLPERRHGRFEPPSPIPCERALPWLPLYGGGRRVLGADADEDLLIAILEALWFQPDAQAELFLPWVADPRDRVRWTAVRLLRLSAPLSLDLPAALQKLRASPDDCVAWNAKRGLEQRAWERGHRKQP
ncbi:MAG: hypothetical protein ABIO70_32630 [Pseudomonadota bacterium]